MMWKVRWVLPRKTPRAQSGRPGSESSTMPTIPHTTWVGAAERLGPTRAFLRSRGEGGLTEPQRSPGGHRRYSRYQLRLAGRARELVDQGNPLEAACRIIILEGQLSQ